MFVPPDQRSVPPRWEPRRPPRSADRNGNAAITLIILISVLALFAPIAGGTIIGVAATLFGHQSAPASASDQRVLATPHTATNN